MKINSLYLLILPGLLMAMTGVGVGDLATAGFTGAHLGTSVLWAVVLGGVFKFVLTEGLARWQLASGQSWIQGCIEHFKVPFLIFMLIYFIPWCWFVAGAQVNAIGVAASAILANFGWEVPKTAAGIIHSMVALVLVWLGGIGKFNTVMTVLAAILFVSVIGLLFFLPISYEQIAQGLIPRIPEQKEAFSWVIALMGGVGGTLTIICYGYWLTHSNRSGQIGLKQSRIDILLSYTLTCLFGIAMVVIGSIAAQSGKGLNLLLSISSYLDNEVKPGLGLVFLIGSWAAILSSLLGVWQAVPQIFADAWYRLNGHNKTLTSLPNTHAYKIWLVVLACVPLISLVMTFEDIQKLYSLVGALFMPILACSLLWLNNKRIQASYRNGLITNFSLVAILVFFSTSAVLKYL